MTEVIIRESPVIWMLLIAGLGYLGWRIYRDFFGKR